jgi:predicted HicB family RNase H-like nuclease
MKAFTLRLSEKLHRAFRVALAKNGESAQKILGDAVKRYVEEA